MINKQAPTESATKANGQLNGLSPQVGLLEMPLSKRYSKNLAFRESQESCKESFQEFLQDSCSPSRGIKELGQEIAKQPSKPSVSSVCETASNSKCRFRHLRSVKMHEKDSG